MDNLVQLSALIANTMHRTDLGDLIPDWVKMCEAEINRRLRLSHMVRFFTMTTNGNGQAEIPPNILYMKNIEIEGQNYPLVAASRSEFDGLPPRQGLAQNYSIQGRSLLFYPNPGVVTVHARGTRALDPVTETSGNYVLESLPDLYLYGTLKHSAPYLIEDERLPVWIGMFDRIMDDANKQDRRFASPVSPSIRPNHNVNVGHRR